MILSSPELARPNGFLIILVAALLMILFFDHWNSFSFLCCYTDTGSACWERDFLVAPQCSTWPHHAYFDFME